ncbi:hypothetical protein [Kribbella soli]|uniref:Uncharacterized protein n=1 Tax=Kribbella soli TaxID=1124743 RepID=A0A4R0HA23_9ACTN|nr:hypothetical protein [Kribbella soli]TCC07737.1 hypothetical protein E0H45_17415 [Kribbella soli]
MSDVYGWFNGLQPAAAAALVSLIVALVTTVATVLIAPSVKYAFDRRLENRKLDLAYRFEQRKALKDHIGRHKGAFLESAEALSGRLQNFHVHEQRGWLELKGKYTGEIAYYPKTFAYRLLLALGTGRVLEREALFIDASVASDDDFSFLKAVKLNALVWRMASLFDQVPYNDEEAEDHFFKDSLASMADSFFEDGKVLSLRQFTTAIAQHEHPYVDVFRFFDGMHAKDGRLRYQRLVCAHLVLMVTLNSFGYDFQQTEQGKLRDVATLLSAPGVRANLIQLIQRMKLERDASFAQLVEILAEPTSISPAYQKPAV